MNDDPHLLDRFVVAQRAIHPAALEELRNGAKRTHWIWFIFPQVAGLGSSTMAVRYAIKSRVEAVAYLSHPLLGVRLHECAAVLLSLEGKSAREVMGEPDDLKLKSSMTLFSAVSPPGSIYHAVLQRYFSGSADPRTLRYLEAQE